MGSLSPDEKTANPAEILLHELLVHKVELEMQNEELRRAYNALEEARDRYIDLYEFAPVGYITINREGLISEINLTGSALLGVDRTKLINRRFSKFVAPQDRDLWHRLFMNMMQHPNRREARILPGDDTCRRIPVLCPFRLPAPGTIGYAADVAGRSDRYQQAQAGLEGIAYPRYRL